jgi:predicted LPLAT superfamily acyltransferase
MLRRPVFFMTGLYLGGNRYRLHFETLADFSQVPRPTATPPCAGAGPLRQPP